MLYVFLLGYMNMSVDKKTWQRRYFAVHKNFVLYSFKAHQVRYMPLLSTLIFKNNPVKI